MVFVAKGWDNIEQQAAQQEANRERSGTPEIWTSHVNPAKGGAPITVRFLEQGVDINNFPTHEYKVPDGKGGFSTRRFTCLGEINMPCPGCQAGLKTKYRSVHNVIWRNRPVYRRGADNKVIKDPNTQKPIIEGYQDTVVVLNAASTTADMLRQKDAHYRGLMTWDFVLSFSGGNFQPYTLEPADPAAGPQPMSENDLLLFQTQRHDLDKFMAPPSMQEAASIIARYGQNSGMSPNAQMNTGPPSVSTANVVPPGANGFLAGAQLPVGVNTFAGVAPPPSAPVDPAQAVPPPQPQQPPVQPPPVSQPPAPPAPQPVPQQPPVAPAPAQQ